MQLILLGLIFVIGLFIYYLYSTSGGSPKKKEEKKKKSIDEDLERKENVIFLPDDIEKAKERHKKK